MRVLRLPRIRGDRPFSGTLCYQPCGATPHTRGSTVEIKCTRCKKIGYPAYAGIDPALHAALEVPGGLPRIRGDRPYPQEGEGAPGEATPHTRGSTFLKNHLTFC